MAGSPVSLKLKDKEISFEKTDLAGQANGAVLMRAGDTVALITAVMSPFESSSMGFFPLTVDYEERFYAAGKILGSRFVRREGRPTDEAILTARLVDRAVRPLFPADLKREVQVITTCLSWDGVNDPDILGLLGASSALSLSDIPWQGPIAGLRVGRVEGNFILNPSYEERSKGDLDIVFAGTKEGNDLALNMIEGAGNEVEESVLEDALSFAKPFLLTTIEFIEKLQESSGKPKIILTEPAEKESFEKELKDFLGDKLQKALFQGDKQTRMQGVNALSRELVEFANSVRSQASNNAAKDFFEKEVDSLVHEGVLKEGKRVDDRGLEQIRPLSAQVAMLPRTHGSGLFIRGETKTLSILTLGAPGDQKLLEGMEFIGKKRFLHHYNFPPYAPGEVKPLRGPGRREIGHGMLAEKALLPVIPSFDEFPYTMRIVTEVLSSNGSTSMASCCSSSLALMDAGVPIKNPVAGISMGLMSVGNNWKLLTDIQGPEDHHGDMDFKIAGTQVGVTALQLDVKIRGISQEIFKQALVQAKKTREDIIKNVLIKTLEKPRAQLSPLAPRVFSMDINPDKIGLLIGPGGKTINKITADYTVEIDIDDTANKVFVTGENADLATKALQVIKDLVRDVQVGEMYEGKVRRIMEFGAFVEFAGSHEGLVHISQLAPHRVNKVTDVVKVGDVIPVKVIEIDEQGRLNLSLKDATNSRASN